MNKKGHLLTTDFALHNCSRILDKHKMWLKLGSILPDFFLHTMVIGHKWDVTLDNIAVKMKKLWKTGKMDSFSFLRLGYLLHYIEDYFTYPHNVSFYGKFIQHVLYEHGYTKYLEKKDSESCLNTVAETVSSSFNDIKKHLFFPGNIQDFIQYLKEIHLDYLKQSLTFDYEEQRYQYDYAYMQLATVTMLNAFILQFESREKPVYQLEHETVCLLPIQKV